MKDGVGGCVRVWRESGRRWATVSKWTRRRFKGRGMKGIHEGKGEVGQGEGEEIMEKKEEEVRGRAMLCLPRRIKRAGVSVQRTSTFDPAQPRPGRGVRRHCREGARADPSEGQQRCRRQGTHPIGSS